MSKRNYERMSIEDFGAHLLVTGDLDPIYLALRKAFCHPAKGNPTALARWLVAYWCFYHAGVASYLSQLEGKEFWDEMGKAAANDSPAPTGDRWPRGSERRHFRGQAAIGAVQKLRSDFKKPEHVVSVLIGGENEQTFSGITTRAKMLPLFGPWISFKIADMIDRVLALPVTGFDQAAIFMFKDPTVAALRLWALKAGLPESAKPKDEAKAIQQVVDYLIDCFKDSLAPPLKDRPVGLQEVETILCKWKSHMNGHYPLFNDIDDINEGVEPWIKVSTTAELFAKSMPRLGHST